MDAINRCVHKTTLSLEGESVFTMIVGPDGSVKDARFEKGSTLAEDISRCLLEILKALRFPQASGRGEVTLKLTFSLG
jgi:hypothetical protein